MVAYHSSQYPKRTLRAGGFGGSGGGAEGLQTGQYIRDLWPANPKAVCWFQERPIKRAALLGGPIKF